MYLKKVPLHVCVSGTCVANVCNALTLAVGDSARRIKSLLAP